MWQLTDEQEQLREEIRTVVREQIQPRAREIDENCEYPRDLYGVMSREGLLDLSIPPEYGGSGLSIFDTALVLEEVGDAHPSFLSSSTDSFSKSCRRSNARRPIWSRRRS